MSFRVNVNLIILFFIPFCRGTCMLFRSKATVMVIVVHRSTSAQVLTETGAGSRTTHAFRQPPVTPTNSKTTHTPFTEAQNGELTKLQLVICFFILVDKATLKAKFRCWVTRNYLALPFFTVLHLSVVSLVNCSEIA